ncbi:MAG: ABC transporter permease [Nitrospinota bacterium]
MSLLHRFYIKLKIILILVMASIRSKMEYQATFIFMFFAIIIFYAGQLGVILVILAKFGSINGWNLGDMAFLYSLLVFASALTSLFFSALLGFETFIISGNFDRYLLRPISPLAHILASNFEIHAIANLTLGSVALYYGATKGQIEFTAIKLFYFVLTLLGATLIQGAIRIAVSTVTFWTKRNRSLVHVVVFSTKEFILYPVSIYNFYVQVFLTVIFPVAFINYYPSHYFLNKDATGLMFTPLIQFMTPLVGIVLFTFAYMFWRFGINYYQSAGH